MIIKSAHVSSVDSDTFLVRMSEAIKAFQEEGLIVEIQYHPLAINTPRASVLYSALIHGRKEINNVKKEN